MQYIKTLDEHIHAITTDFGDSHHMPCVVVADRINDAYCSLDDETALEAVSILMDECDEIMAAAATMKKRLADYGKEPA